MSLWDLPFVKTLAILILIPPVMTTCAVILKPLIWGY